MAKKDVAILRAMENMAKQSGYTVRWEKGAFQGGSCILEGSKLLVLNRHHPTEVHLGVMARTLRGVRLEDISMSKETYRRIASIIQQYSSE